jgi:hypothetical protein
MGIVYDIKRLAGAVSPEKFPPHARKTIYAQKFSSFRKEWLARAARRLYRHRLSAP